MSVIICEERLTCRDQNVNRWYCHADAQGDCPLARCAVTQKPADPVHPPMPVGHIRACGCPECVAWLEAHEPEGRES